ncbi:mannose-ethanolamine phosphotransferase gpi13 [Actinomortierella ambigua]|uniref:Mannose-ethanolamine phosphotransferase gpi13 n=1 Tax=Actinomortierella ambigua TaxID=1343610 RepID=A0A9P6Q7H8_9FUNG|nr:mannose-ethanolamine phosphotransferase gpi13 [Actinomortierella ambigua]
MVTRRTPAQPSAAVRASVAAEQQRSQPANATARASPIGRPSPTRQQPDQAISKQRSPSIRLAKLLLWLFLFHVGAIYLFTRGFLLSRSVLDSKSECNNTNVESFTGLDAAGDCWYPQRFNKAVVILIDALRFDFVVPHDTPLDEREPYYHNKLPIIHSLLNDKPENTLVFQFVADPPTTTLQRLKALTSGTLPTIIDAGSNFASSALKEDNWLAQFEAARGSDRIRFMGDDTWAGLFPNALNAENSFAFESFDVHDLHTVDNNVTEKLQRILPQQKDWDLLIAHFLGVDHCGHRHGPDNIQMALKLEQMNQQIKKVIDSVSDDTLVLIMGDHGMNGQGDHGGDTDDEVEAALVVYSKQKLLDRKVLDQLQLGDMLRYTKPVGGSVYRTITQIDLVPTLSLLLGLPIPFNNLGHVIPELFLTGSSPEMALRSLLQALRLNAAQVSTYFKSYMNLHPSSDIALASAFEFGDMFAVAEEYLWAQDGQPFSKEVLEQALSLYSQYLRTALTSCKRIWAHFDVPFMAAGGGLLLANTLALIVYIVGFKKSPMPKNLEKFLAGGTLLGITLSRSLKIALSHWPALKESAIGIADVMVFSVASLSLAGFCLSMALHAYEHKMFKISCPRIRLPPLSGFLACLFIFVNCLIFASNSYIVHESTFIIGFLQTFGLIGLLFSFRVPDPIARKRAVLLTLGFMVLTRLISYSTVCREEQGVHCTHTYYASAFHTVPSQWSLVTLVASGAVTPFVIRRFLKQSKSLNGVAILWIDYGLRLGIVLGTVYAVLDFEESKAEAMRGGAMGRTLEPFAVGTTQSGPYAYIKTLLVRLAFGMALVVGPVAWWSSPLCLDIQTVDETLSEPFATTTARGQQQQQQQRNGSQASGVKTERKIYILGYGNAFGSSYYVLLTMLVLAVSLTQKPLGTLLLYLGLALISIVVELVDIWRDADIARWTTAIVERAQRETVAIPGTNNNNNNNSNINSGDGHAAGADAADQEQTQQQQQQEEPIHPPTPNSLLPVTVFSLLGNLLFFATGHQATLSSIQWGSAFVGVTRMNYYVSPLLVVVNTLGPFMIVAAAVPLITLWKMAPKADRTGKIMVFSELTRICMMMMMHQSLVLVANMFFTGGLFRRHLMVWKVFAPRFMLQASAMLVMDLVLVTVVSLVGLRRIMTEMSTVLGVKIE